MEHAVELKPGDEKGTSNNSPQVSVGDTVKVKIISIDYDKMKVGLTMKL